MRVYRLVLCLLAVLLLETCSLARADDVAAPSQKAVRFLTVRLVDEQERPVAGAEVGLFVEKHSELPDWKLHFGVTSDAMGIARFREGAGEFEPLRVYVRHAGRQLVAVQNISDKQARGEVMLTLRPACRVCCRLVCNELEELGRPPQSDLANCVIRLDGIPFLDYAGKVADFHPLLPPGKFELEARLPGTHSTHRTLEIKPGERELDLGTLACRATRLALLQGEPAPELHDVLAWKNSLPLKLADLRGKVVLLEFWGWWCGPCLDRGIPELRALHEEFRGQGLAIVGIHVDLESNEVGSVRELDQKLAEVRRTGWKGNDIPFAVALTAGNETPHASDVTRKARNKLCAEYGVVGYPTTVLIDRKGNVVGRFHPALEQDRARLKKLLGSP